MTREEIKRRAELYSALAEGKTIQILNMDGNWVDVEVKKLNYIPETIKFRIKPELKCELPDGLSKRDVRHKFKQCPNSKEIIQKMYPQIDCTGSAYMRNQVFLEKIREDNRWVELYNMIADINNSPDNINFRIKT